MLTRCSLQRDATESITCAIMILVRQEPSWDEAIRHAEADPLLGKVRAAGWHSAAALLAQRGC